MEYFTTAVSMASNGSLSSAASFGRVYQTMKLQIPSLSGVVSETSAEIQVQGSHNNSTFNAVQVYNPTSATFNNLMVKSTIGGIWMEIDQAAGFKYLRVRIPSFNVSAVMSFVFYGSNPFMN
mgnify:CR=1 FL=1